MIKLLQSMAGVDPNGLPVAYRRGDLVEVGSANQKRAIEAQIAEEATKDDISEWNKKQEKEAAERAERVKEHEVENTRQAEATKKALDKIKKYESSAERERRQHHERLEAKDHKFRLNRAKEKQEEKAKNDAATKKKNDAYTERKIAESKGRKAKKSSGRSNKSE